MRFKFFVAVIAILLVNIVLTSVSAQTVINKTQPISSNIEALQALPTLIDSIKPPELKNPDWLQTKLAEQQQYSKINTGSNIIVNYSVTTRGIITADLSEFKYQANQTLNDSRGWPRLNISFKEVTEGGDFVLVLSEASQVPSFSDGCSADWSCRVGIYVIINQDRWLNASEAWNQSGGSLRDYRNMVVNHETGHWLGHDHLGCGGSGQVAPVMLQQSIDLQGCSFNPWPLNSELWSSRLGI